MSGLTGAHRLGGRDRDPFRPDSAALDAGSARHRFSAWRAYGFMAVTSFGLASLVFTAFHTRPSVYGPAPSEASSLAAVSVASAPSQPAFPDLSFARLCAERIAATRSTSPYSGAQDDFDRGAAHAAFIEYYHALFCGEAVRSPSLSRAPEAMALLALAVEDAAAQRYDFSQGELAGCLRRDPGLNEGRLILGDVLWKRGRREAARARWREASLTSGDASRAARDALRSLAS